MDRLHRAILGTVAKMGALSAKELALYHKGLRIDTLDKLTRQHLLSAKLRPSDDVLVYSITQRGRNAIAPKPATPPPRGRTAPTGTYEGVDTPPARAGANDYRKYPSRIGNRRVWMSGRVEVNKKET